MTIYTMDNTIVTSTGGIATSSACCCNEQWKKCSDDTNAAVLDSQQTTHDYAWLCIGSVWVKCYYDASTGTSATNPSVLEQCDTVPTECADLIGWPGSDNFNGTGCNSGSKVDDSWNVRWAQDTTDGTTTHNGANIAMTSPSSATLKIEDMRCKIASYGGSFTTTVDYSSLVLSGIGAEGATLYCYINGSLYYIQRAYISGNHRVAWNGGSSVVAAGALLSGTFKLERIGNTLKGYIDATQYFSTTVSGNLTSILFNCSTNSGSTGCSVTYDNFTYVDGSAADIYIDPTGTACT